MNKTLILLLSALFSLAQINGEEQKYVTVKLMGRLGNQLFQIATAYAYSLDRSLPLVIPDLVNENGWQVHANAERLFLDRIAHHHLPETPFVWQEPSYNYTKLPRASRLSLVGYFQSEKYFKHRRQEILELFAPPAGMKEKILSKYPQLATEELTVGVQIRDYRQEFQAKDDYHPTHGREYYAKAMTHFSDDALFLVSSNNLEFAKECTLGLKEKIIYLDSSDYIEEFYTLTLCKSFIISNSTFGWWASWLSTCPNKLTIVPRPWFARPYNDEEMCRDLFLPEFLVID